MTLPPPNICKRIRQLFRLMASPNPNEKANAEDKLKKLLAKHALSWNDIPTIAAAADADDEIKARRPRQVPTEQRQNRCAD